MAKKKIFNKLKAFLTGDDTEKFNARQKAELDKMLKEREMELIAQKKLRKLENKYSPKEKRSASDVFSQIKSYRQKNLSNRQDRFKRTEQRKKKYTNIENNRKSGRKSPKSDMTKIGNRIRELEKQRKNKMLGNKRRF